MEERGKTRSPEELQAETRQWFESIPVSQSIFDFIADLQQGGAVNLSSAIHRLTSRQSELKPILLKKIDDLLALSSTTQSFREALRFLAKEVITNGRTMRREDPAQGTVGASNALRDSLELNPGIGTGIGIYSLVGAKKGEEVLFRFLTKDFAEGMATVLCRGIDPTFPGVRVIDAETILPYALMEQKDFFLKWHKEYAAHYGEELFS